jgi:hypothetical protein
MITPVELPTCPAFPAPTCLSASRTSRYISSVLTDASPVSHYFQTLVNRNCTSDKITLVLHNPCKSTPHVNNIQYSFTITDYPKLLTTKNGTARTEDSTYAPSAVTYAYFSVVEVQIESQLCDIERNQQAQADAFCLLMADLEADMTRILTELENMLTTISNDVTGYVLIGLQGADGVIPQENHNITQLQGKLMQLNPLFQEAIAPRSASPTSIVTSPPHKNQKLNDAETMNGISRQ